MMKIEIIGEASDLEIKKAKDLLYEYLGDFKKEFDNENVVMHINMNSEKERYTFNTIKCSELELLEKFQEFKNSI